MLRVNDRVRVSALWSAFWGQRGRVTALDPVMVLLDEYEHPIRIDPVSLEMEAAS